MANTPGGLPYPLGTDFVIDGDNAIRALAEAIEAKYGTGSRMFNAARGGVPPDGTAYTLVMTEDATKATVPAFTYTPKAAGAADPWTALQSGWYSYTVSVHMGEYAPVGTLISMSIAGHEQKAYASGARGDWLTLSGQWRCDGTAATIPRWNVTRMNGGNTRDVNGTMFLTRLRSI